MHWVEVAYGVEEHWAESGGVEGDTGQEPALVAIETG